MIDLTGAPWRKSSRSNGGGECVEVADLTGAAWRTSTRSGNGDCVEVADNLAGVVAVRDSKDPTGPALIFPPATWTAFVADLRAGHLDH
jgi:hypothetical protein